MLSFPTDRKASVGDGAREYVRHRPERTLLYQLVEAYYRFSCLGWRQRVRRCRAMSSGSSRITSSAAASSMVPYGCAATAVMQNIW